MEYISAENQRTLNQAYKTALILSTAFCLTVITFMVMARFITPGDPIPGSEKWQLPITIGVIIWGVLVVIIRRVLMSRLVMAQALTHGIGSVVKNLFTVTVICLAASEVAAIAGLLFYLFTGDYQYSWRLGTVGILLILYSFPRRGEWEQAVIAGARGKA